METAETLRKRHGLYLFFTRVLLPAPAMDGKTKKKQ